MGMLPKNAKGRTDQLQADGHGLFSIPLESKGKASCATPERLLS
jgi:hypothetical protein